MNAIVELRQYTLKPGKRDVLIDLFEREFVESQEELGMDLIGTFRDADDADRFIWLRGFPDMESRTISLAAFYGGPVWKANRIAANDTMIDSDNVLLLRPAWDSAGFPKGGVRAPVGATAPPKSMVTANIYYLHAPVTAAFLEPFRKLVTPNIIAAFVTETSENTFPALPVREGENVFVWFSLFADRVGAPALPSELERQLSKPVQTLRLLPTARSRLHT
jgi:hypothetical protein